MDGKPLDLIAFGTIICKGVAWVTNIKVLFQTLFVKKNFKILFLKIAFD